MVELTITRLKILFLAGLHLLLGHRASQPSKLGSILDGLLPLRREADGRSKTRPRLVLSIERLMNIKLTKTWQKRLPI